MLTVSAGSNCQIIYNLDFCDQVSYAVPSNPNVFNSTALAQLYDDSARSAYTGFNYSLQQIPCDAPNTAQYSLTKTCDDCAREYKNWLCAVKIPRCEDFSSDKAYLQPRALGYNFINGSSLPQDNPYANQTFKDRISTNSSRNPLIDDQIKPGPYKELMPCNELCYALVRSCPAKLGFGCPTEGRMMAMSYGVSGECNDPSGLFIPSSAVGLRISGVAIFASLLVSAWMLFC